MSVTLPPEIEGRIPHWIESGRYPDAASVVEFARLAQRKHGHDGATYAQA
jgi:Arc/MetJ-type ribon-helix-helix transcriptional regulator